MNDDELREQAQERLLTAELAAVLANEPPRAARAWQPFYVAALVLLGAFVAVGVAWLARADRSEAQQPEFDPVDPWFEREWPWRRVATALGRRAAEAPSGVDEFLVTLRDEDSTDLAAVLDRPVVRRLALCWRNTAATPNVSPKLWQRIATRSELEVLMLSSLPLPPDRLRELRLAPALRYVVLQDATTFDVATAQALVEVPRLRGIMLSTFGDVTSESLAALAGIPDLDALVLGARIDVQELTRTLPKLRNLRAFTFESFGSTDSIDADALRPLAGMQRLRSFDVSPWKLDDAALAALPPQLEMLACSSLEGCTAEGLRSLRRLTNLRFLRLRGLSASRQRDLPQLLAELALERFDMLTAAPDAATWRALQSQPKLRWLTFRRQRSPLADVVAGCLACEHLEVLTLFEEQLPAPEQFAPLRDHPTLRRIELRLVERPGAPVIDAADERIAALRASVRAQVDVIQQ